MMFLEDILSVSGQPGLYKKVSQAKNSLIVESIDTGKRMPVFSASKISSLKDVAIYTSDKEQALSEILINAFSISEKYSSLHHKSTDAELKTWFQEILPEYDRERVYVSDMRKVKLWFDLLKKAGILTQEAIDAYRVEQVNAQPEETEKPAE